MGTEMEVVTEKGSWDLGRCHSNHRRENFCSVGGGCGPVLSAVGPWQVTSYFHI